MYRNSTIGVVVPAYNEEGLVGDVLQEIPDYVDRIYAVNDASTDGTWNDILDVSHAASQASGRQDIDFRLGAGAGGERSEFIETAQAPASVVQLFENRVGEYQIQEKYVAIDHVENFGAGGAIKTGYLAALIDGVDIIVTIDADGQMNPTIMERLIDPVVGGTAEYAKGTRLLTGEHRREMPWIRRFGNAVLTYMTKVASGYWGVSDSQNGYTAISRSALLEMGVEDLFEYYAYCNAVLIRLNARETPVADVEVPTKYGDETSDIEYSQFIVKVTPMLFRKFLWRLRQKYATRGARSIVLSYILGGISLLLGLVGTIGLRLLGSDDQPQHYSLSLTLVGAILIGLAMASERSASSDLVEIIYTADRETKSDLATAVESTD